MIERDEGQPLIIGAGIAGLTIAYRLAQYGLRPTVVESANFVATGATTRNQGWLHAGTFHAQSIPDATLAARVSQRCKHGHRYFRQVCPEAIEDPVTPTVAVTLDGSRIRELVERWKAADVEHRKISRRELEMLSPIIAKKNIAAAWLVRDVVINTRLLCARLVSAIRLLGGEVFCRARLAKIEIGNAVFESDGRPYRSEPSFIIVAAGCGTNEVLAKYWDHTLPLRFWKSHLLLTSRISGAAVYGMDAGEVSLAHHGDKTIVGRNDDALLCTEPSYEVDQSEVLLLKSALQRLVNIKSNRLASAVACTKVDVAQTPVTDRNLDIAVVEISSNILSVFPGKMTEAPFLADVVARRVVNTSGFAIVSPRPIDLATFAG